MQQYAKIKHDITPDFEQVALLYDNNPTPFLVLKSIGSSNDAQIVYVNSALELLTDKNRIDLLGHNVVQAFSGLYDGVITPCIEATNTRSKHTYYTDFNIVNKFCQINCFPLWQCFCGCIINEIHDNSSQDHWLNIYYRKVLELISSVVGVRSSEVGAHICRMRGYTETLCRAAVDLYPELNIDERTIQAISEASMLHDVGKIGIPDEILLKPAALTDDEFERMKYHTEIGSKIAGEIGQLSVEPDISRYSYEICRYHHERYDGNGYPNGLSGDTIPFCSQVVALADAYDALTNDRVYKAAHSPETTYDMIMNGDCGIFSSRMLRCFSNVKDEFKRITNSYRNALNSVIKE